jgi:23S rRNA U2552 (ribose-2'-O)-methylase RlmE/FtsJ
MDKPMSGIGFRLMTLVFKVRDFLRPRMDLLKETGIGSGFYVLDFGCGPGSYIQPLSQLVGVSGVIYALDMHPLAIKEDQSKATRYGIKNIKTIESDCNTGLNENWLVQTFCDGQKNTQLFKVRTVENPRHLRFADLAPPSHRPWRNRIEEVS